MGGLALIVPTLSVSCLGFSEGGTSEVYGVKISVEVQRGIPWIPPLFGASLIGVATSSPS